MSTPARACGPVSLGVVTEQQRRRIDQVLAPDYTAQVGDLDINELRRRRDEAEEVERELSYYRRLLHGRMDLLAFELRRRRGEETRSMIEALPEIIAAGLGEGSTAGSYRHLSLELNLPEITGRRDIDQVLEDDVFARVKEMDVSDLEGIQMALAEAESQISDTRRRLHGVIDALQGEIIERYKRGMADADVGS